MIRVKLLTDEASLAIMTMHLEHRVQLPSSVSSERSATFSSQTRWMDDATRRQTQPRWQTATVHAEECPPSLSSLYATERSLPLCTIVRRWTEERTSSCRPHTMIVLCSFCRSRPSHAQRVASPWQLVDFISSSCYNCCVLYKQCCKLTELRLSTSNWNTYFWFVL